MKSEALSEEGTLEHAPVPAFSSIITYLPPPQLQFSIFLLTQIFLHHRRSAPTFSAVERKVIVHSARLANGSYSYRVVTYTWTGRACCHGQSIQARREPIVIKHVQQATHSCSHSRGRLRYRRRTAYPVRSGQTVRGTAR